MASTTTPSPGPAGTTIDQITWWDMDAAGIDINRVERDEIEVTYVWRTRPATDHPQEGDLQVTFGPADDDAHGTWGWSVEVKDWAGEGVGGWSSSSAPAWFATAAETVAYVAEVTAPND
jgi:hypothetical protein